MSLQLSLQLLILLPLGFMAGMINAMIGGGGLITVPGLFATLPNALPASLLGTDKFSVIWGHLFAARQYARHIKYPWKLLGFVATSAFCGSYLGARAVHSLPVEWVRPAVIVLLAIMLIYTWFKPEFGAKDDAQPITGRTLAIGLLVGAGIGFYDGFFGPGAGTFLVFLFIRCFRFDFLRASACAKIANFATNAAALIFFIPHGLVLYSFAIPMGIAAICGSYVGTRLTVKGGSVWMRKVFLLLVLILMGKLIFDVIRG